MCCLAKRNRLIVINFFSSKNEVNNESFAISFVTQRKGGTELNSTSWRCREISVIEITPTFFLLSPFQFYVRITSKRERLHQDRMTPILMQPDNQDIVTTALRCCYIKV